MYIENEPIPLFKTEGLFRDELLSYPTEVRECYEYDDESRTYFLPDYEFSQWQMHIPTVDEPIQIGASTAPNIIINQIKDIEGVMPAIYGEFLIEPYYSLSELYHVKKGLPLLLNENSKEDVFFVGHIEEPTIRKAFLKLYKEENPLDIIVLDNNKTTYRCGIKNDDGTLKYPYMVINHDGLLSINGEKGLLECKTVGINSKHRSLVKQGVVPFNYYCQVQYEMKGLNLSYAYICFKLGMSLTDYKYVKIERDDEFIDKMMEIVDRFVSDFNANIEPTPIGQDVKCLATFYRRNAGNYNPSLAPVELPRDLAPVVCDLATKCFNIDQTKKQLEQLENERNHILCEHIFPLVGQANECYVAYGSQKMEVHLKNSSKKGLKLDKERFREEQPELFERYSEKIEEVVIDTKALKKDEPLLYEEYIRSKNLTENKQNYCEIRYA